MIFLLKNLIKGAASVNLFGYSSNSYKSENNQNLNEISIISELRGISEEKALKRYFSEIFCGQILMFCLSLICLGAMVWMAFSKTDDVYFILPIILLNVLWVAPKLLMVHYFNKL